MNGTAVSFAMTDGPQSAAIAEAVPSAPASVERVTRNKAGELEVVLRGRDVPVVNVKVARCFPWSLPGTYISILDKDGKEVCLLKSLDDLDGISRQTVENELRDKNFKPAIRRVIRHDDEFGIVSITAETDRGEVTFQIRSRDDIRVLSSTRALFRDADGNQYEVTDLSALDAASRHSLAEYF